MKFRIFLTEIFPLIALRENINIFNPFIFFQFFKANLTCLCILFPTISAIGYCNFFLTNIIIKTMCYPRMGIKSFPEI